MLNCGSAIENREEEVRKTLFIQILSPEKEKKKSNETMISILTQERLLGASLGVILTSVVVFEQRRYIFASISDSQSHSQAREPIFGKKLRSDFAHSWNKTVDQTFGPLIKSLSSRGW